MKPQKPVSEGVRRRKEGKKRQIENSVCVYLFVYLCLFVSMFQSYFILYSLVYYFAS